MLQENSLLFRPMIYFGHVQNFEEADECYDEEWDFAAPWQAFLDSNTSNSSQSQIGLFIHWQDESD